ncbi:MAG TPA: ferrous iron transport protein A [Chroococcidiopsis sp.]
MSKANHHLANLKAGHTAIIASLDMPPGLHQRLLALGFRQGRPVKMLRRSWLSGPVHVRVGTTEVMLRRRDAQNIAITLLSPEPLAPEPLSHELLAPEPLALEPLLVEALTVEPGLSQPTAVGEYQ